MATGSSGGLIVATESTLEYSFPVDVTQLSSKGRIYKLVAKDAERARVATRLDLLELPHLEAEITLMPANGGLITISGAVKADVVQACVVSLVAVKDNIREEFSLAFTRSASKPVAEDEELEISTDDDPPELLTGDEIDLGEIVVEQLALFLNPYPRAPGAVFENPVEDLEDDEKPTISPFAVLAKLKTKNKNN